MSQVTLTFPDGNQKNFDKGITSQEIASSIAPSLLKKAINFGGTSIRDYAAIDGTLGNFQHKFKVYNKEKQKILGFKIKRVVQYGRSTFYCPSIQKKIYNSNN